MPDDHPIVERCPECRGTGWKNMATCWACEGSGVKRPILKLGDRVKYVKNIHEAIPEQYKPTIGIEGKVSYVPPKSEKWVYVEFEKPANKAGDTILVFYYDELEVIGHD